MDFDPGRGVIGIPHTGSFSWQAVGSYLTLDVPPSTPWNLLGFALIYDAREALAERMLDEGRDWLLMVDHDMVLPPDTLHRLLAHGRPIVGTLAFKRYPPHQPCVYDRLDLEGDRLDIHYMRDWPQGLIEVAGVGTACILIRREALERIPRPWFFPAPGIGEDLTFCLRARKAGVPIHVDTTLNIRHLTTTSVGEGHYRRCASS